MAGRGHRGEPTVEDTDRGGVHVDLWQDVVIGVSPQWRTQTGEEYVWTDGRTWS